MGCKYTDSRQFTIGYKHCKPDIKDTIMGSKAKRHVHKYMRRNVSYVDVWACALPNCTHYMPPHMAELVEGKHSICWSCEKVFVMNILNMEANDGKPICDDCIGKRADRDETRINPLDIQDFLTQRGDISNISGK